MNVYIENESKKQFDIDNWQDLVRNAVLTVAADKSLPDLLDVNILLVDEEEMRKINYENRGIDSPTDVLSFPYFEYDEPGIFMGTIYENEENILGDMIICSDRIVSQAEEYGHSQERELIFLVVHSMLHLVGYDHIEESDGELMRAQEDRIMDILQITR